MMYQTKNPYFEDLIVYRNPAYTVKTFYTIEYIDNKKDFDRIDSHPAAWELYKTIKTESLQEAITKYISLYSRQYSDESDFNHVYDVRMFEQITLNDEIIQERSITDIYNFNGIISSHAGIMNRKNNQLKESLESIENELKTAYSFLEKWNAKKEYEKYKNELKNNWF